MNKIWEEQNDGPAAKERKTLRVTAAGPIGMEEDFFEPIVH